MEMQFVPMMAGPSILMLLWGLFAFIIWVGMIVCVVVVTINIAKIAGSLGRLENKFDELKWELTEIKEIIRQKQ
jgi:membrane protein insertase Oxa1/YidC/SpoIIIJ